MILQAANEKVIASLSWLIEDTIVLVVISLAGNEDLNHGLYLCPPANTACGHANKR